MASSARLMPSSSSAANTDLARNPAIYSLDPKSHGSVMDDLIRNIFESSESGSGGGGDGKTVEEVWTEIAGRKMDGGDGSGADGEITLEEYLHNEDVRVPAGFAVDPAVVGQQPGPMAVESQNHQNQVLGFGNGAESVGRGRKRPMLDMVDRAAMQRQKRMIKNRESAARSRERKQAYTVELESLVTQLEEENARLLKEQEELHKQRLKELMNNLIPVTESKKPPRLLRRTQSCDGWVEDVIADTYRR